MMRLGAEALNAFEMILRVSPPVATRALPKVLAWLDAALSSTLSRCQHRRQLESSNDQEVHYSCGNQQASDLIACEDVAGFVAQHIKLGPLSALVSCTLGNCVAAGPLRRSAEHLRRLRLMALLLRGPLVTRCCSKVLAACAVPPLNAGGDVIGGIGGYMHGTAPRPTEGGEAVKAATEAEADLEQQLCTQTARVICIALQCLGDAVIPSTQEAVSVGALTTDRTQRYDIHFDETVERALSAAFLPPQLRWLPDASAHTAAGIVPISDFGLPSNGVREEAWCHWAFADDDSAVLEDTPRKAALYMLGSMKASCSSGGLGEHAR